MLGCSERAALLCLSCCLLTALPCLGEEGSAEEEDEDFQERGSGSSVFQLLHSFPADSPFTPDTPGTPANCTQRFVLPSAPAACWDDLAGAEEFTRSRLLMLQNRAALQAVSVSSGVGEGEGEEGGEQSYQVQARDEVRGIHADHRSAAETMRTVEKVFVALAEKRREGAEQGVLTSMNDHLIHTRTAIDHRLAVASVLENKLSSLEQTLMNMQLRINKLIQ